MDGSREKLKTQAVAGVKWVFLGRFVERGIRFGTMVVLSRLLLPEEFGLFVLGVAVAGAATYLRSFGIDAALIQRQDTYERKVTDTAFAVLTFGGVILFLLFYAAAPALATLLDNVAVTPVLRVLGISILIGSLGRVPLALTEKRLKFSNIAASEIAGRIAFTAFAISAAVAGLGVWSLVIAFLIRQTVAATVVWVGSGWLPHFSFDRKIARELIGYGKFIVGSSAVRYLQSNLDKLIVGRWAGAGPLGLYGLAFNVANLVNAQMVQPLRQVMFPTYARIQHDLGAVKRTFLRSVKYIVFVGAPISVGLVLLAREFVTVVYSEKWAGAATALSVLAVYGLLRSLTDSAIPALRALGKPAVDFRLMLIQIIVMAVLLVPAVKAFGILGAAGAMVLAGSIVLGYMVYLMRGIVRMGTLEIVRAVGPGCLSAAIMGLLIWGFKLNVDVLATPLGPWGLPVVVLGGGLAYVLCLWILQKQELVALKTLLTARMSERT